MKRILHRSLFRSCGLRAMAKSTSLILLASALLPGCGSQELPAPKTNDCITTNAIAGNSKKIIIQIDHLTVNAKWIVSIKDTKSNEVKLHPVTPSFTIQPGFVDKGQDYLLSFFLCGQDSHAIPVSVQVFQDGIVTYVKTHLTNETIRYTVQ